MTGCKEVENGLKQGAHCRQGDYLGDCWSRLDKARCGGLDWDGSIGREKQTDFVPFGKFLHLREPN